MEISEIQPVELNLGFGWTLYLYFADEQNEIEFKQFELLYDYLERLLFAHTLHDNSTNSFLVLPIIDFNVVVAKVTAENFEEIKAKIAAYRADPVKFQGFGASVQSDSVISDTEHH